ncbi:MAG: hypothetical protein EZS28_051840, partial [Streblomastix strix]
MNLDAAERLSKLLDLEEEKDDEMDKEEVKRNQKEQIEQQSSFSTYDPDPIHPLPFIFPFSIITHSPLPIHLASLPFSQSFNQQNVAQFGWETGEVKIAVDELKKKRNKRRQEKKKENMMKNKKIIEIEQDVEVGKQIINQKEENDNDNDNDDEEEEEELKYELQCDVYVRG